MLVTVLPIEHRIRHKEAVFTIHAQGGLVATGGMNGEMKIWNENGDLVQTIKQHKGSVASVRFSRDGAYLASAGDDGRVYVFSRSDWRIIHTIEHGADATHVEWTGDFLYSADLNGTLIITAHKTWEETARFSKDEPITGLAVSPDGRWACTYSEGTLTMYRGASPTAKLEIEKGVIMESLNSRLSFAPNNRFLSVGLQFNRKSPSVDVFDTRLQRIFSLLGHVAPSEITSFCPLAFKKDGKQHFVLVVASQDLSISLWSTVNPRPFLLMKNFTEAPVLDLCWNGHVLYASSYDGVVKRVVFEAGELGEPVPPEEEEDYVDIPYGPKTIELTSVSAPSLTIPPIEHPNIYAHESGLPKWELNGMPLEEAINKQDGHNDGSLKPECAKPGSEIEQAQGIHKDGPLEPATSKDITENSVAPAPKRVKPTMLNSNDAVPRPGLLLKGPSSSLVLFDSNLPDRIKVQRTEPFTARINSVYSLELSEPAGPLGVFRDAKLFFSVPGPVNKVCYSQEYLAIASSAVQIYEIHTSRLLLPPIAHRTAFMDILGDEILLVNTQGKMLILNICTKQSHSTDLPKTKGLTNVAFHRKYGVVALFGSESLYYHRDMQCWFVLTPEFSSIYSTSQDYQNDTDQTIPFLESQLATCILIGDQQGISTAAAQLFGIIARIGYLSDENEHKLAYVIKHCKDREFVQKLYLEMSRLPFLQRFVEKYADV